MRRVLFITLALLIGAQVQAAEHEFAHCILCHGTDANGNIQIRAPKLSGMDSWYLTRQLQAFRSGMRGTDANDVNGSEMRIVALQLSEDAVARAVAYVTALQSRPIPATVRGDSRKGAQLYSSCAACHGPKGEGNAALEAPTLTRSSDWYLVGQLNNYRKGWRGTNPQDKQGTAMRAAAAALPDTQAVVDVVAYINTLRGPSR